MRRIYELIWIASDGNSQTKVIALDGYMSKKKTHTFLQHIAESDYAEVLIKNNIVNLPESDDYFDDPTTEQIVQAINQYADQNNIKFLFDYKQIKQN